MKRLFVWGTVACGVAAAYIMYKRGEPISQIAKKAVSDPVGSLISEVRNA